MGQFISAVILAAGSSHRLGEPKQLLSLGKTTFLERTVDNILGSRVNEVIVVLGYRAEEMARLLSSRPVTIAANPDYQKGMSTSVIAGVKSVSREAEGIIFALADQPLVDNATVNHLLENFGSQEKDIIIPTYHGKRGNPVVFSTAYKDELLQLTGDVGGRAVIARHPDRVLELPVDCEGVVIDVDTWDSYHLAIEKFKQKENNQVLSGSMFIIVTGVIGVGKSTVCRRLVQIIRDKGLVCGGILTFKSAEGGIIIEDVRSGEKTTLAKINDGTANAPGGPMTARYLFYQSGIDFGIQAIHKAVSADVIVIDEIGQLELLGEGLVPALDIIRSGRFKNCLLVVRKELLPLYLPQFSTLPRVFETTTENRDKLPQKISSILLEEPD